MPETVFPYDDEVTSPYDDEVKNPHEGSGEATAEDDEVEVPAKRKPGRPKKTAE